MTKMPAIFVSHGAPTLILEDVPARDFLAGLGKMLPRPKAILVASAHWETPTPELSLAHTPATVYDFFGFPAELSRIRYDAPGAPEMAQRAIDLLKANGFGAVGDSGQGLDHGAWVPLKLIYPDADIPTAQISIQSQLGPAHHIAVGRALAALREDGVLIIGSGSMVHNLRSLAYGRHDVIAPWAVAFDDWMAAKLAAGDEAALVAYRQHAPHAVQAQPRDEHLLPLYVALGAGGAGAKATRLHHSFTHGALSMAAYSFA